LLLASGCVGANEVVGAAGEVVVDVPAEKLGAPFVFCTASSGFPNDANDAAGALGGSLSFGVGAVNDANDAAGALGNSLSLGVGAVNKNEGGVGFSAAGAAEVKADEKPPLVGELLGGESEPSSMKGFGAPVAC
jgi:hypothetical protein